MTPDPECTNCQGRGCMGCVMREYDHTCADDCPFCCRSGWTISPSGRDITQGPVYAPDGTYACGNPGCWSCWPEGAANTVGYSAGAVCCPDETSARRHQHRATWAEDAIVRIAERLGLQHHGLRPVRRWTT